MITDTYIFHSFRRVDELLELSLQQLSLGPPESGKSQENETLQRLQESLIKIKTIVDKISSSGRPVFSNRYVPVDYVTILDVISKLIERQDNERTPIESLVTRTISQYVVLICYYTLSNECLLFLPPAYETGRYYKSIADSKSKSMLYSLQTSPVKLLSFSKQIYNKVEKLNKVESASDLSVDTLKRFGTAIFEDLRPQFNRVMMVRNLQLVGLPKESKKWMSFVLDLPRAMIRDELYNKTEAIDHLTKEYTIKLGQLVTEFQSSQNGSELEYTDKVNALAGFLGLPKSSNLSDIVSHTGNFQTSIKQRQIKKPNRMTRYWPSALLTLLYGPASCLYIWESRYKILHFFQENVIDFAMGLIYNWVYIPLKHVWSTVRHDEDSSIAVMSKGTLNSEMNSLTRMIVSFVTENSSSQVDDSILVQQVEHGDLTSFMEIYETQLQHPIKNIVTGDLVRSLLIQIQKTKVDGSLALNGIDKMLQSQQLVFGVVAVSPALLIIYTSAVCLYRLIRVGNFWSNIQRYKERLSSSLNNVERILNYSAVKKSSVNETYLNQGLLTIEVCNMANLGSLIVPKVRLSEWLRDVEEIADSKLSDGAKLNVINRMYHVYSRYF